MINDNPAKTPDKVQMPDTGMWVMFSAIVPVFLFWLGAIVLRAFAAPVILTKVLGVLCLIAIVCLFIKGILMMRCPLCNRVNVGRYPLGTLTPYCRRCGVEFDMRQYKLW